MTKRIKDRFFNFGIRTICTATASQEAADPLNGTPQENNIYNFKVHIYKHLIIGTKVIIQFNATNNALTTIKTLN